MRANRSVLAWGWLVGCVIGDIVHSTPITFVIFQAAIFLYLALTGTLYHIIRVTLESIEKVYLRNENAQDPSRQY